MDRKYTCKGFGKEYEVEASSNGHAQTKAASLYKEESGRFEPITFLAVFFSTEVVDRKKTGRKSSMASRKGGL